MTQLSLLGDTLPVKPVKTVAVQKPPTIERKPKQLTAKQQAQRDADKAASELLQRVAIEVVGWKWMSFLGLPKHNHPLYCDHTARTVGIRVREFMSPQMLANARWREFLAEKDGRDADMTEPHAYCYCSSSGYAWPGFDGDFIADVETAIRKARRWPHFQEAVKTVTRTDAERRRPHIISDRVIFEAALIAIRSASRVD